MLYWDADLKGFGVVCSGTTNSKTYIVQHSLPTGLKRRVTVGACNVLKFAAAKDKAKEVLADFFKGINPKGGRNDKCTLRTALEYLAAQKKSSYHRARTIATELRLTCISGSTCPCASSRQRWWSSATAASPPKTSAAVSPPQTMR